MRAAPDRARRLWTAWARGRSTTELRWLAAILALAFVLRLVWVLYAMREPQGVHDPIFYWGYGQAIAAGVGYQLPAVGSIGGGPTAYYPIGYPAALGAVFALVTHTPIPDNMQLTAGFFHIFLGVAKAVFVHDFRRRLFNSPVALLARAWLAVFATLTFYTGALITDTL